MRARACRHVQQVGYPIIVGLIRASDTSARQDESSKRDAKSHEAFLLAWHADFDWQEAVNSRQIRSRCALQKKES
jgi:hypothetical protein